VDVIGFRSFALATVATLALAISLAAGAQAQPSSNARFSRADVNHDGRVTFQEYESFVGNRMMKAKGPRAEKFRSLNPEQQVSLLQKRFQKLDHGHKGYLEPADWQGRRG
jgi:hypothetical protein